MAATQNLYMDIHYLQEAVLKLQKEIQDLKGIVLEKNATAKSFKSEIAALKDLYDTNAEYIKNILAEQGIFLKTIIESVGPAPKFVTVFPIKNQEEFDEVECQINDDNHSDMVESVYYLIRNGGFKRNVRALFGDGIIMEHNIDGKQGKIPLTKYKKLMDVFLQAGQKYGSCEKDSLRELRCALKAVKNRHHKLACMKRKSSY